MSDGMGREPAYLSSHATNRYFIPNWGRKYILIFRRVVKHKLYLLAFVGIVHTNAERVDIPPPVRSFAKYWVCGCTALTIDERTNTHIGDIVNLLPRRIKKRRINYGMGRILIPRRGIPVPRCLRP